MSAQVHFEIFLKQGRKHAWSLVEACPDRDEALERAAAVLKEHPAGSVRVSKETFDPDDRLFRTATIFEEGGEKFEEDRRADRKEELSCRSPRDLVSARARSAIARALEDWLERQRALAIELLHRVDLVESLEAAGTELQHAIQKIAIAQASSADASVQHFVKQLHALVEKAIEGLYAEHKARGFPTLEKGGAADLLSKLETSRDREHALRGAIAGRLKGSRGWGEKLDRLVGIAAEANAGGGTPWAMQVIGEFLGEIVAIRDARNAMLADVADLGGEMDALTDLFRGAAVDEGRLTKTGARLASLFARNLFDDARKVIARAILKELRSPKRLRPSNFHEEVVLNRSIADRLIAAACPLIAAEEIMEAFVMRSSRLLEPEAIQGLLDSAVDPGDEVFKMLEFEENVVGEHNKKKLAAYVRARCGAHQVETHFIYNEAPTLQRLSQLAGLIRMLAASGFDDKDQAEIGQKFDALAIAIEDKDKLFAKIERRAMPALDKASALLRLAARGAVPAGPLCEDARKRAARLMSSPEARQALASGDPVARATAQDISEMMSALAPASQAA